MTLGLFALSLTSCTTVTNRDLKMGTPPRLSGISQTTRTQPLVIFQPRLPGWRKTLHLDHSAELFSKTHPTARIVTFDLESPFSNEQWKRMNLVIEDLIQGAPSPHLTAVLSPPDSKLAREWLATDPKIKEVWTQVLADERVDHALQLSQTSRHLFLRSRSYVNGLKEALPEFFNRPVWILRDTGSQTEYFEFTVDALRSSAPMAQVVNYKPEDFEKAWGQIKSKLDGNDISVVFLSFRHEHYSKIKDDLVLQRAQRLILYSKSFTPYAPSQAQGAETHIHFWLPFVGSGSENILSDSCEFVRQYKKSFGVRPDFHAAYLFATLQAILQDRAGTLDSDYKIQNSERKPIHSILGNLSFGPSGRVQNLPYPAFLTWQGDRITLKMRAQKDAPEKFREPLSGEDRQSENREPKKSQSVKLCRDLLPHELSGMSFQF